MEKSEFDLILPKELKDLEPKREITLVKGDITEVKADAIVSPTTPDLETLPIGVAGAILRKAGGKPFEEARELGNKLRTIKGETMYTAPVGSAVPTSAGELENTRMVIHAVSVDMDERGELVCDTRVVSQAAEGVLKVADKVSVSSIAFPAIGTGLYRLPIKDSVVSIYGTAVDFFKSHPATPVKKVSIVLYSQEAFNEAQKVVDQTFFEGEVKEVKEIGEELPVDRISKVSSLEELQKTLPRDLTEKLGEGGEGIKETTEMLISLTPFAPEPATFGRDAFNNIVAINSETGEPLPKEEQQKMIDVALEAGFVQKVEGEDNRYSVRKDLQDAVKRAIGVE